MRVRAAVVTAFILGCAEPPLAVQEPTRAQLQEAADRFEAVDLDGRALSLRELRGRVVLLEFWATWCAPCLDDVPWLRRAYVRHPQRFEIIGISLDVADRATLTSWLRRQDVTWPVVHDRRGWSSPAISPFGFDRIPFNILVAADGRVVGTNVRGERLLRALDTLLGEKGPG